VKVGSRQVHTRLRAYIMTLALIGLVASPLWGAFAGDSFPISTYPMFATTRSTEAKLTYVLLVNDAGDEWTPPPDAIASNQVLQAQETLRQALRQGDGATAALCERIAQRVRGAGAISVKIVTSTYDAFRYARGDYEPIVSQVNGTCRVEP
jgi:hypothetical protein